MSSRLLVLLLLTAEPRGGKVVMGYIGDAKDIEKLDLTAMTHVVVAFLAPTAKGELEDVWHVEGKLKRLKKGPKVIVSIGGANHGGHDRFGPICADAALRKSLARNIANYLKKHDLDGVDIDYEFPTGNKESFTLLMKEVYSAVDRSKTVMFCVSAGWMLSEYEFKALAEYSDYAFYMSYGLPMQNAGRPQNTYGGVKLSESSAKGSLDYMIEQGYPAEKIVMGLAFFDSRHRPWREIKREKQTELTPPVIVQTIEAVLDPKKSVLAGRKTLGGVGFWEWGYEDPETANDLSQTIKSEMRKY
jgi:chitinase